MPGVVGPYHSLSESDRRGLVAMVDSGHSVRPAAGELGCHYVHALNFCHAHGLPVVYKAKRADRSGNQACQLVELIQYGLSVHQAACRCGMHLTAAYAIAIEAGCHIRLTRYVRKARQTQLRVEYLRLRLASLPVGDAGVPVEIHRRACLAFEKGLIKSNRPREEFIPVGEDATTYKRLMKALRQRHDVVESGRLRSPALPSGVDPYKRTSNRYICFEERVLIADLLREHVPLRVIGRCLGRSASSIQREVRRNHSAEDPYRAETVQLKACARRLWPKIPKLLADKKLWDYVCAQLRAQWSPEEISNRLPIGGCQEFCV